MPNGKVVDFPKVFTQEHLAEAKKLAARFLIEAKKHYELEDSVLFFRSVGPAPGYSTFLLLHEILTEEMGYEDVEWFVHEHFLWDLVVFRKNIPLL